MYTSCTPTSCYTPRIIVVSQIRFVASLESGSTTTLAPVSALPDDVAFANCNFTAATVVSPTQSSSFLYDCWESGRIEFLASPSLCNPPDTLKQEILRLLHKVWSAMHLSGSYVNTLVSS